MPTALHDNTQQRRKREWFKDNALKVVGVALAGILGFLGKWGFDEINAMRKEISTLTQKVDEMQQRELDLVWQTMRDFGEKIEDSRVKIMVLDEIYGRAAGSFGYHPEPNSPMANQPRELSPDEIKRRIEEELQQELEYEDDYKDYKMEQQIRKGYPTKGK